MIMERSRWHNDTKTMRKTEHVVLISLDNSVVHLMSRRYLFKIGYLQHKLGGNKKRRDLSTVWKSKGYRYALLVPTHACFPAIKKIENKK